MGCASNPGVGGLTPGQLEVLSKIEVHEGSIERPYTILGTVKGLSCHRNAYKDQYLTTAETMERAALLAPPFESDSNEWVTRRETAELSLGDGRTGIRRP